MTEFRTFDPDNPPEWLDSRWWIDTPNCNHVDNPVHQARLQAVADQVSTLFLDRQVSSGYDIGAGDGGLLSLLNRNFRWPFWGYEIISDSVRYAQEVRGVDVRQADVLRDDLPEADLVVATEFLEHLEDPHGVVSQLSERHRWAIFSSPHSETPEYHEWNHAWVWDREGYAHMIHDNGWHIVNHYDAEWSQIVVARSVSDAPI